MFYNAAAKKNGITVRAGHSHNTNYEHNLVGWLDRAMSFFFTYGLTDRFACGQEAGKALFRGKPFLFLPNGVDAAAFGPDEAQRAALRRQLGVPEGAPLYGHIGRFCQQKNHGYLLDIFEQILKRQPRARLVLLGEGETLEAIKAKAAPLGDRVIFAGVQGNTGAYYRAMDAFLLPSLFEGLPVVLVEAQAAGLPCFVSDTVDRTADFGGHMTFLPLGRPEAWAEAVCASSLTRAGDALERTRAAGYDIRTTAAWLQEFYQTAYANAPARK